MCLLVAIYAWNSAVEVSQKYLAHYPRVIDHHTHTLNVLLVIFSCFTTRSLCLMEIAVVTVPLPILTYGNYRHRNMCQGWLRENFANAVPMVLIYCSGGSKGLFDGTFHQSLLHITALTTEEVGEVRYFMDLNIFHSHIVYHVNLKNTAHTDGHPSGFSVPLIRLKPSILLHKVPFHKYHVESLFIG